MDRLPLQHSCLAQGVPAPEHPGFDHGGHAMRCVGTSGVGPWYKRVCYYSASISFGSRNKLFSTAGDRNTSSVRVLPALRRWNNKRM
mmetsp:Transcript_12104/g.13525  ORF Transcript_12104/g.13525 Transcript_12104/m.13525 type:complete len:87 (+) Transcript_12104:451-711(+)